MLKPTYHLTGQGRVDNEIDSRIGTINRHRLTWVLSIFLIVHLAHVAAFWPFTHIPSTETERWRNEVILVHSALLAFIGVILPGSFLLERHCRKASAILNGIPEIVGLVYLLSGAALAIIDQRVTPSLNPLLAASIGVGVVIVTRPIVALFQYAVTLAAFLIGVAWIQKEPNLLLTIRVNSVTSIGLGLGLTIIQWRNQVRSLVQQRRINEQQRELEEKNRELTILATRDPLTNLLNRAEFSREVNKEIYRMQSLGMKACLIMADIDNFKLINDAHGHPVGDSILVEVAGIMRRMLRSTDIVGRFGGEEFAILLPGRSIEEGVQVAERLRGAINERRFVAGEQSIGVTASFGAAELKTGLSDALLQCYRAADRGLYQAKNDGRNCVRVGD